MARGSSRVKNVVSTNRFTRKNVALLNALCHADERQRAAIIRTADNHLVRIICECALNVLQGVVDLTNSQKSGLKNTNTC